MLLIILFFQQLLRMIPKTDACILKGTNGIAAEMLNWQEQHQRAFVFFLSLVKSALNITVVFEALLNSKSTAAQWNSVDLRTTQHVQGLDRCKATCLCKR